MSDNQDIIERIGEIERKISDGEKSLLGARSNITISWIFLLVSIGIIISIGATAAKVVGFLLLAANVWRLYRGEKTKKEIEESLKEYRDKKAELQASLTVEE